MKRFSWFTDGVKEAESDRYVLHEDHLAIVEKLKAEMASLQDRLEEEYTHGWHDGIYHAKTNQD